MKTKKYRPRSGRPRSGPASQAAKLDGQYNITVRAFGAVVVLLGWVAIILGT